PAERQKPSPPVEPVVIAKRTQIFLPLGDKPADTQLDTWSFWVATNAFIENQGLGASSLDGLAQNSAGVGFGGGAGGGGFSGGVGAPLNSALPAVVAGPVE